MQIKQQDTYVFLKKALKPYLNKGYAFSPDTNFFMECPEIFQYLKSKKEKVLISKITYDELDSGKSTRSEASKLEKERAWKRRKGLEAMDNAHAIRVPTPVSSYIQSKKLGVSNDEKIIASYLKYTEDTKESVLFLTLDRGAKTIARSVDLPIAEFDITEFFRLKNQAKKPTPKKTESKRPTTYGHKKKKNPIVRLFGGIFNSVISLVTFILRVVILGFIGLLVLAIIVNIMKTNENTKNFNHIEGDQSQVAMEVTRAKNHSSKNTYEIEVALTNHTSQQILLTGYYSKDELKQKKELESNPSNGLRKQASQYLKEGSYGVKVIYKDGSEEFQGFHETLAPREKRTINIQSNGQLDEIEQINLQYRESENEAYKTLSINPL